MSKKKEFNFDSEAAYIPGIPVTQAVYSRVVSRGLPFIKASNFDLSLVGGVAAIHADKTKTRRERKKWCMVMAAFDYKQTEFLHGYLDGSPKETELYEINLREDEHLIMLRVMSKEEFKIFEDKFLAEDKAMKAMISQKMTVAE